VSCEKKVESVEKVEKVEKEQVVVIYLKTRPGGTG